MKASEMFSCNHDLVTEKNVNVMQQAELMGIIHFVAKVIDIFWGLNLITMKLRVHLYKLSIESCLLGLACQKI